MVDNGFIIRGMAFLTLHFKDGRFINQWLDGGQEDAPPLFSYFDSRGLTTHCFELHSNNLDTGEADYYEIPLKECEKGLPKIQTILDPE